MPLQLLLFGGGDKLTLINPEPCAFSTILFATASYAILRHAYRKDDKEERVALRFRALCDDSPSPSKPARYWLTAIFQ